MKRVLAQVLVVAIACLVAVSVSFAADEKKGDRKPRQTAAERFKAMDKNGNEKVTLEEFKASEFGKRLGEKAEAYFTRMAGEDKELTLKEYEEAIAKMREGGRKKTDDKK